MKNSNTFMFFTLVFGLILGLASASAIDVLPLASRHLSFNGRISPEAFTRSDDDHLCSAPTGVAFEYGNRTNQDELLADCNDLSKAFKSLIDVVVNLTESCVSLAGPSQLRGNFTLMGSWGNCSLWMQCVDDNTQNEVTLDYGDIGDVIKLAIDGLNSTGLSKNSSILSVNASSECQLHTDWIVGFNSSNAGR